MFFETLWLRWFWETLGATFTLRILVHILDSEQVTAMTCPACAKQQ